MFVSAAEDVSLSVLRTSASSLSGVRVLDLM